MQALARRSESAPKTVPATLDIRPARRGDMPRIARFICSSAEWYREFVDPKDMGQHEVDEAWQEENFQRREFFLGRERGEPVGTISLQDFGEYLYLGYVYLDAKHVGKGFGHSLLRFAVEAACSRGKRGMVLIAHPKATWAVKAYEKFGFRCVAKDRAEVLAWNDGALQGYYEEGFHLFRYEV